MKTSDMYNTFWTTFTLNMTIDKPSEFYINSDYWYKGRIFMDVFDNTDQQWLQQGQDFVYRRGRGDEKDVHTFLITNKEFHGKDIKIQFTDISQTDKDLHDPHRVFDHNDRYLVVDA